MKCLIVVRFIMTGVLTYVGGIFLMRQTDYIDLLLDGVALIYIVEIASVLYEQILRDEVRDQTEDIYPMRVKMYGIEWLNRQPALVDIICIAVLVGGSYAILHHHRETIVETVYDALDCTCRTRGDKCVEAQKFDFDFWHDYWKDVVPGVFGNVEKLKASGASVAAAGVSYLLHKGPEQTTAPAGEIFAHHKMHASGTTHARGKRRMLNARAVEKSDVFDDSGDDKARSTSSEHLHRKSAHHQNPEGRHYEKHKKNHRRQEK